MRRIRAAAVALVLSAACAGCESWTGFGFHVDGPEVPRLRQVLALETGTMVADVGAGKGGLTFALAREVGSSGHVFSTEIDPERLRRSMDVLSRLVADGRPEPVAAALWDALSSAGHGRAGDGDGEGQGARPSTTHGERQ